MNKDRKLRKRSFLKTLIAKHHRLDTKTIEIRVLKPLLA